MILHSGQTGVERGAHDGALAAGFGVAGVMCRTARDELGPIPTDVAQHLTHHTEHGYRAAAVATMQTAHGVVIVVPNVAEDLRTRRTGWLRRTARAGRVPHCMFEPAADFDEIERWVKTVDVKDERRRIHVTGPRATRWAEGEAVARRVVKFLGALAFDI